MQWKNVEMELLNTDMKWYYLSDGKVLVGKLQFKDFPKLLNIISLYRIINREKIEQI